MFEPGYYKSNYRALRLREMIRWHGRYRGLCSWLKSRLMPTSRAGTWMPGLWAENECKRDDLRQGFWDATRKHRADFERLDFVQCHLSKPRRPLDPAVLDYGGIFYLDPSRCYFGQLIYSKRYLRAKHKVLNHLVFAFTAVFENGSFSCTNNRLVFDSVSGGGVIRMKSRDVTQIYDRFQEELQRRGEKPRPFADVDALREWFDARQIKNFEDHVRRGLFIRMTEPEVAAAMADLERHGPGSGPLLLRRRKLRLKFLGATLVLILLGVLVLYWCQRGQPWNTIEYHGLQFKLNRSYTDYDDYKDDPDNLNTNELGRIERVMESVTYPLSFKDSKEFIYTTSDLEFPGYGQSVSLGQTDDGSTLQIISTEIPQADKERVVVGQSESDGTWRLVDDFIYDNGETNDIRGVRLEHQQLKYIDEEGRLVRKKSLER